MTSPRPTFRIKKNGYDRFAVDDAIEEYAARVNELEKRLTLYEQELRKADQKLSDLQVKYVEMVNASQAQREAADNIARISLREANEIISTAQRNADALIREALSTARLILTDLSKLYNDADAVKSSTRRKLEDLLAQLDEFELPKMPDLRWLNEAEERMR